MWKRLQGHGREKERRISNPVLLQTTYDEDQLRHIPNVSDVQNANYQPNSQFLGANPQYHDTHVTQTTPDYRASNIPTVSSLYSQPSPELNYDSQFAEAPHSGHADISPPSSPEPEESQQSPAQPKRYRSMRDVSPVDENRGGPVSTTKTASNIPVLRKVPSNLREKESAPKQKFWSGKVAPNSKVRWDEYSGEPTSSNAGKTSQVSPGTYAKKPLPFSEQRPMGYHVTVSGPREHAKKSTTFSDRVGHFGTRPPQLDTALVKPREPWKGASGRAEIVHPFRDQATKQPLASQRKVDRKRASNLPQDVPDLLATSVERHPVPVDTAPVADVPKEFETYEDPIKPTVPLKVRRNSPPRSLASPVSPHSLVNQSLASPTTLHGRAGPPVHPYPSPITPTSDQASPPAANLGGSSKNDSVQPPSTPANANVHQRPIDTTPGSTASKDFGPTSHFSWTTHNTSATYQHSPPPSPPPPLPAVNPGANHVTQEPISAASSILNRRRPVQPSDKLPTRKPVSSPAAEPHTRMTPDPPSPRPSSTFSTNTHKALPRPPTEISAADHVDILEAQMDDLRIRRSNVYRLLQDLNKRAPPNPMVTDFRRMRLVDKRKEEFQNELAEIQKEEHDLGLKLHRAWRKRAIADPGSESAIWVRRVTR